MAFYNKRAAVNVFGFFFTVFLVTSVLLFVIIGFHYLLYDYAIQPTVDIADNLISDAALKAPINAIAATYLNNIKYFDILFLTVVVSMFIESIISAVNTRRNGFISFFGLITIGNIFLIFVLNFVMQVRGWLLNEVLYNIVTIIPNTPFIDMFINYSYYIGVLWYLIIVVLIQVDIEPIIEKASSVFNKQESKGRFEE